MKNSSQFQTGIAFFTNLQKSIPLKYKYGLYILISPEMDIYNTEINDIISDYFTRASIKKCTIICTNSYKISSDMFSAKTHIVKINESEIDSLLRAYEFVNYYPTMIIVTLDNLRSRNCSNIISSGKITPVEIIKNSIFYYNPKSELNGSLIIHLKGILLFNMNQLFKFILRLLPPSVAENLYTKLSMKDGLRILNNNDLSSTTIFLAPYKGTGDVYLAASYLPDWIKNHNITNYKFYVIGGANVKIAKLFDLEAISITSRQMDSLLRTITSGLKSELNYKILHHDAPKMQTGIMDALRNVNGINFLDVYKHGVYNLAPNTQASNPIWNYNTDKYFTDTIIRNKTILIAPYSYTLPTPPKSFWIKLASALKSKGYYVCTNVSGKESPIKGTIPLFVPYKDLVPFLNDAGFFIGIRSGLCEIISSSTCKKVILYKSGFDWNGGDSIDYFSLPTMGLCDAIEMEYSKTTDFTLFCSDVSDKF